MDNIKTDISNVLVIGCGGAGLRAAIEANLKGLNVKVLGKRPKEDSHTGLAAGGINAAFGSLDPQDSWQQHFADTFLEGYKIGDPEQIEILVKESKNVVREIDNWGANFSKLNNGDFNQRFFGAHKFRRTCFIGDYTGKAILNALLRKSDELNIHIDDERYVTDILVKDNICFGAVSFNIKNGEITIHISDAVILCTGGHTRIWKKSSSRKNENTGDGYFLALKSGCSLIDMEMVQFHPTGMLYPEEIAGTLVTEAVRGEGGILKNSLGERFMENYDKQRMELSTRDKIAVANYTEIIEGRCSNKGGIFLDISHKEKDFIIEKIPNVYRQFLENQFLDISKEPMEVAPTAHYSMGGIFVDSKTHSTNVRGLYAAGEVAGGLHGANRLGGNSLAEILVFGKIVGEEAVAYSKSLKSTIRCQDVIKMAVGNLQKCFKKGRYLAISLQNELREIMWNYCGVIKNEKKLKKGLHLLNILKKKLVDIDVRISDENYQDLINLCDFEASLYTAEATFLSAIERKESRGAHQREDFLSQSFKYDLNYLISMDKDKKLFIKEKRLKKIDKELDNFLSKSNQTFSTKEKLLE